MSIQDVISQMELLHEQHVALLELAQEKKDVLIRNDVDRLTMIVSQESKLLKKVSEIEQSWKQAVAEFLNGKGVSSSQVRGTRDLIRLVFQAEDKQRLQNAQTALMETIGELQELNRMNQNLIQHSLQYVNYHLSLLVEDPMEDVIYKKPSIGAASGRIGGSFNAKL